MCIATLAAIGTGISSVGAIGGGIAQANSASYQGQVARNNSTIAKQNARYAASAGAANTEVEGLKSKARLNSVRAGIAANNLDVNTGSPAETQISQREIGGLDTAKVANNAALQVYGYESQSTNFKAQAAADEAEVTPDIVGGIFKGVGGVLSNASVDSLIGGEPSVPEPYQWMRSGPVDANGTGLVY